MWACGVGDPIFVSDVCFFPWHCVLMIDEVICFDYSVAAAVLQIVVSVAEVETTF